VHPKKSPVVYLGVKNEVHSNSHPLFETLRLIMWQFNGILLFIGKEVNRILMKKHFKIDSRLILNLGRDSIKDKETAIIELVKNSYDADATRVEIDIIYKSEDKFIRIADNGCGMSEEEIDNNWLRIGFSEKRNNKISKNRRRKTGEKGIGRISSDRLGASLFLKTKANNCNPFGLKVDWSMFDREGTDISNIPIEVINKSNIDIPGNGSTGTEVIIKDLRDKWSRNDILKLSNELSILTPPFTEVSDFSIFLRNDIDRNLNGFIESPFYQKAEIHLSAELDGNIVQYRIEDRFSEETKIEEKRIRFESLVQKTNISDVHEEIKLDIGAVNLDILFYPREARLLADSKLRLTDLREFLNKNAGIKIYRDNIRVKPYGNPDVPEGDWIGLAERKTRDPAGISRPTWRVAANQVVGGVFIGRDENQSLVDSSSREGLILDTSFKKLKLLVLGCISLLESHRHFRYKEKGKIIEEKVPSQLVLELGSELKILKRDLRTIKNGTVRNFV